MDELGIFAKYWQPGEVKTRLAAQLGDETAARFHRVCLQTLLARFSDAADRRVLAFAPCDREGEFAVLAGPRWQTQPQSSGDLGQRMSHYFGAAFAAGSSAVVLIGSDSPTLPVPFVNEAFARLRVTDAVLGPADDGGYYLIGLARPLPEAFAGVAWSTPHVRQQTLNKLAAAGCRCDLLPPWYDVDTPQDLDRLRGELARTSSHEFDALRSAVQHAN